MTQNGPYPGRSSQPWSGGGADEPYREPVEPYREPVEPYREPADPWGGGWGGQPQSVPPVQGATYQSGGDYTPPTGPPGGWSPGDRPPRRRGGRRVPIAALVALSGLLVCGGLATSAWLLTRDPEPDPAPAAGAPVPVPTSPGPTTPAGTAPAPPLSTKDARFVAKGQCVRNDGTADVPEMSISVCASGAYEVLARFDGRTTGEADAEAKCSKVQNYSKWYFFDSELDSLDFVLCLKER